MNLSEKAINHILDTKKFDFSSEFVLSIVSTDVTVNDDHELLIYTNADAESIAIMLAAAAEKMEIIREALKLL